VTTEDQVAVLCMLATRYKQLSSLKTQAAARPADPIRLLSRRWWWCVGPRMTRWWRLCSG
jgi:hypothetical protein